MIGSIVEIKRIMLASSPGTYRQSMGARELKTSDVARHSPLFDFLNIYAPATDDARLSLCFGGPGPVRQVNPGRAALAAPQHGRDAVPRPHLAHGPADQRLRSLRLGRCGCGCAELPRPDIMPSTGAPAKALSSQEHRETKRSMIARSTAAYRQSMGARELTIIDFALHSPLIDFFIYAPATDDARLSLCFGGPGPVRQVDPGRAALAAPQHGLDPVPRPHLAHGPADQRVPRERRGARRPRGALAVLGQPLGEARQNHGGYARRAVGRRR
jgi:hypothetical protein